MVKADAYGCGIEQVAGALSAAGCRTFFVANLAEARRARAVARETIVYVLNGLLPGTAPAYADQNLRPVIGSRIEFDEWTTFRAASGWNGGAALHVDTGMNRSGLSHGELSQLVARLRQSLAGINLVLIMSHLACADEPDRDMNWVQLARFRQLSASGEPTRLEQGSNQHLQPLGGWQRQTRLPVLH